MSPISFSNQRSCSTNRQTRDTRARLAVSQNETGLSLIISTSTPASVAPPSRSAAASSSSRMSTAESNVRIILFSGKYQTDACVSHLQFLATLQVGRLAPLLPPPQPWTASTTPINTIFQITQCPASPQVSISRFPLARLQKANRESFYFHSLTLDAIAIPNIPPLDMPPDFPLDFFLLRSPAPSRPDRRRVPR